MIELEQVSHTAGGVRILDGIDVRFRPNAFNVVLGPNGAGKSTLLKVATGLVRPSAGTVCYGGQPIEAIEAGALARMRAVLSQHVELSFPLPVEDVVLMGRYPHYGRVPSARDREIVRRALELVGLSDRMRQSYPTLSGGEQQKVQLARVLAQIWNYDTPRTHKYLFLDEPTSELDIHYQIHLLNVVRDLLAYDCTVIAILHDLNQALQYGDAFVVLSDGRVASQAASADEISRELLEQVFRVRAHRVVDAETGRGLWQFAL